MKPVFEFTLQATDENNPIRRLTVRIVGLEREAAARLVNTVYGHGYQELYVIAGPRLNEE